MMVRPIRTAPGRQRKSNAGRPLMSHVLKYIVRGVDVEDHDDAELIENLYRQTYPDGSQALNVQAGGGYWWIAYYHGEPAAFLGMVRSDQGLAAGYICRVGVIAKHRGNGLQKRLMRVCERKAKALGWTEIVSDTNDNPASSNSFIACGYGTYLPKDKWALAGAIYWRKAL